MSVLSIDIGGTKFSMAVFEDGHMVARESRATDREGGRDWMASQLLEVASAWKKRTHWIDAALGSGARRFQKTAGRLVNPRRRLERLRLVWLLSSELGVPTLMDNDANVGALGEQKFRRRPVR